MNIFFVFVLAGFVLLMIIFNVYFRYKILGDYKYLIRNKIEFGMGYIFNSKRLESEVIPQYPKHENIIRSFCSKIRNSLYVAIGLIVLILIFAYLIKNFLI